MKLDITVSAATIELDRKFLRKALLQAAREVAKRASSMVRASAGGGAQYGSHRASVPGAIPANRSGFLADDMSVRAGKGDLSANVTDQAYYALALEAGARGGGRRGGGTRTKRGVQQTSRDMKPRPFLSVALANMQGDIQRRIEQAVDSGIEFKNTK